MATLPQGITKAPRSKGEYYAETARHAYTITKGPLRGHLWQAVPRGPHNPWDVRFGETLTDIGRSIDTER